MEIKKIQLNEEINKRDIERMVQMLYTLSEIENIEVDMDDKLVFLTLNSNLSDDQIRRIFKTLGHSLEIKY